MYVALCAVFLCADRQTPYLLSNSAIRCTTVTLSSCMTPGASCANEATRTPFCFCILSVSEGRRVSRDGSQIDLLLFSILFYYRTKYRIAVRDVINLRINLLNVIRLSDERIQFNWFILRPTLDGRSQIKVHTDERTQVHSARSFLTVTHPSTNRGRRCLTSVNVPCTEVALVATVTYIYVGQLI